MSTNEAKERLLKSIRSEVDDDAVLNAMRKVPRELFVPAESRHLAYEDIPLPIGYGQTISQPLIVALMTHALDLLPTDKVLEIGTGSGYQAAILANLARKVVSVERIQVLADSARTILAELGYTNVEIIVIENDIGCPSEGPFDAILVTAASPRLQTSLLEQMVVGGRLVIPVGSPREQELMKVTKSSDGYSVKSLGSCRFVPLIGKGAWDSDEEFHSA